MKMPQAFTEIEAEEMIYDDGGFSWGSIVGIVCTVGGLVAAGALCATGVGGAIAPMIATTAGTTVGSTVSSVSSACESSEPEPLPPTPGF